MTPSELSERIRQIERQIFEIRVRLPRHSPPTSMLVELDELEDELRRLQDGLPTSEGQLG
jgi:hypothetical protein